MSIETNNPQDTILLNKDINDNKQDENIIIEVIPIMRYVNNTKGYKPKCNIEYCHVYFKKSNEEIKRNYFTIDDNVEKLKLVLDIRIQHLCELFCKWDCVKK